MSRVPLATSLRVVFWAATWGVGVAIGVALGGWLTVVGGAGAPGTESLELAEDVLLLPGLAGSVTFLVHLAGQAVVAALRAERGVSRDGHGKDDDSEQDGREQVAREVGPEIEPPAS